MTAWDHRKFREFLLEQQRLRGWRQGDLARAVGTSSSVIGRWLSGESRPTPGMLDKVARALRVDYVFLLELTGYRAKDSSAPSPRQAALCAMLMRVELTDERYAALTRLISAYEELSPQAASGARGAASGAR